MSNRIGTSRRIQCLPAPDISSTLCCSHEETHIKLAEGEGFEPPVPFRVQWFSRPSGPSASGYSARMRCLCRFAINTIALALITLAGGCGTPPAARPTAARAARATTISSTLFGEWRTFQQPKLVDGVPDYSRGRDGRAGSATWPDSSAARRDRSDRLAHPAAGRLPHRARRDERPRLRPSRAASRGRTTRRSTSRSSRSESDQPAREGPFASDGGRALELHVSAVRRATRRRWPPECARSRACSSRRRRT